MSVYHNQKISQSWYTFLQEHIVVYFNELLLLHRDWLCSHVHTFFLAHSQSQRLKKAAVQIRVFCRVKPHPMPALICTSDGQGIKAEVDGKEQLFQFDRVFTAASSQQDVFNEVSELIQSALDGFQACSLYTLSLRSYTRYTKAQSIYL